MFENIALNTLSNTPVEAFYQTGEPAGFLSRAASGLSGFIKNNPNQFAIAADMVGSRLAPNSPFSGVGTAFGKSNIANEAAQEGKNKMALLEQLIKGLTEGNKPGGNKISLSMGPEGRLKVDSSSNLDIGDLSSQAVKADQSVDPKAFLDSIAIR